MRERDQTTTKTMEKEEKEEAGRRKKLTEEDVTSHPLSIFPRPHPLPFVLSFTIQLTLLFSGI